MSGLFQKFKKNVLKTESVTVSNDTLLDNLFVPVAIINSNGQVIRSKIAWQDKFGTNVLVVADTANSKVQDIQTPYGE